MAYIGRQLARGENKLFDDISSSFNGSTTTFNLTVSSVATATATPYQLFVSLGGVMQKPNTDFTTAGNQITFTTAPAAGLSCWIMMQGDTIDQAAIPDASVTPSKISGSNFAFSGDLRLKDADGSHYVGFASPSTVSTNKVWTLPAADGSASQYLQTNGSGVLAWATVSVGGATAIRFNDNVKALWGTGDDLEIFHNGSNSIINDAGTGDLLLQVGGATQATISSTGVVIANNLTVSGTTTTINTQTLDVEDKNVVIGKVSSPSDTTADGGGWTLKGASDKTFNWVNATDAWTSSEHIHLGDNKKLLIGTGSDLEIYHDATDSYITSATGELRVYSNGGILRMRAKTNENAILAIPDQGVELYYDNVKKLETTSGGINVTGAINVNGSPLSSAPTITATASGSISANAPVIVNSSGQVKAITQTAASLGSVDNISSTNANIEMIMPALAYDTQENMFFCSHRYSSTMYFTGGTLSGTDITWHGSYSQGSSKYYGSVSTDNAGRALITYKATQCYGRMYSYIGGWSSVVEGSQTQIQGNSSQCEAPTNAHLDGVYWVAAYNDESPSPDAGVARIVERSTSGNGLAFSCGTQATWSTDDPNNIKVCKISATKFAIMWIGAGAVRSIIGDRNGTGITFGSVVEIIASGSSADNSYPDMCYDSVNEKLVFAYGDTGKGAIRVGTVSGNSITWSSEQVFYSSAMAEHIGISATAGNIFIIFANDGDSDDGWYTTGSSFDSSANTYSFATAAEFESGSVEQCWTATAEDGKIGFVFKDKGNNNIGKSRVMQTASSDLSNTNFIGFSSAGYTNGQTATINVVGNTTTQSSLTPGSKYYVQDDATLATSADTYSVVAGKALTSTSLLITPA